MASRASGRRSHRFGSRARAGVLRGLAVTTLLALAVSCSPPGGGGDGKAVVPKAAAVLVEVERPTFGALSDRLDVTGRVEAYRRADLAPRVEGIVVAVEKVEGDAVKKGDVLARVENDQQALALRMAEIAERQARLGVSQALLGIEEAKSRVAARAVTLEQETRSLERARGQHAELIISDSDLDAAVLAFETAESDHVQAQLAVRRAEEDLNSEELALADAGAKLEKARLELSWANLVAPIDGRITGRWLRLGQRAVPGQTAYAIEDLDSLVLEAALPEKELRALRPGLAVELQSPAWPDGTLAGEVEYVASKIDAEKGSVLARIRLAATEPAALPGMFVSGWIVTEVRHDVLMIPKKALKFDRDRVYVYALDRADPETLRVRRVPLLRGLEDAERVEYLPAEGDVARIGAEDEIVVVGIDRLYDGAEVRVRGEVEDAKAAAVEEVAPAAPAVDAGAGG